MANRGEQLKIDDVNSIIRDCNLYEIIENRLNLIGTYSYNNLKYHGIKHATNVALYALIIANSLKIPKKYNSLLVDASLLHDIGRTTDEEDINHGKNGELFVKNIKKDDEYYNEDYLNILSAIVFGHNGNIDADILINKYKIKDVKIFNLLYKIIIDADILDRTRLVDCVPIDLTKFNYEESLSLLDFSKALNYQKNSEKEELVKKVRENFKKFRHLFTKEEYLEILKTLKEYDPNLEYIKFREVENKLLPFYNRIWIEELSHNSKESFKYLVTCPPAGNRNFQIKDYISASLITNNHMGTFNNNPICIVLEVSEGAILGISDMDMNTVVYEKDKETKGYYYLNEFADKKILTKKRLSVLKTPQEIEKLLMQENIKQNGNILVQKKSTSVYSDIILDASKVKMKGIILKTPCDEIWEEKAKQIQDKFDLPLTRIDINYYLNKYNLNDDKSNTFDIYSVSLIESILTNPKSIDFLSDMLFIQRIGVYAYIKSDVYDDYMIYSEDKSELFFVIKDDNRSLKACINNSQIIYSIDDEIVSKEKFQEVLIKEKKKDLKSMPSRR